MTQAPGMPRNVSKPSPRIPHPAPRAASSPGSLNFEELQRKEGYIHIYIYGHPPPLDRPRNCISDLSRKRGGGGKSTTPKFLEFPKIRNSKKTQVSDFWKLEEFAQNPKNPKFLEFPKSKNPKIPTQVSDFWKLEEFAQNPKKPKIPRDSKNPKTPTPVSDFWKLEEFAQNPKFQKPKKNSSRICSKSKKFPKKSFGFLETRGICSKSKKAQNSSSFQKIQKPQPQFPRNLLKIQKPQPQFRIFGNSRNLLKIQKSPKFLEFPKIQKSKNPNPSFGFLETRGICSKSKKAQNSSSFQKSKIPRNFGFFWISRLPSF